MLFDLRTGRLMFVFFCSGSCQTEARRPIMDPKWMWDGVKWDLPGGMRDVRYRYIDVWDQQREKERRTKRKQDKWRRRTRPGERQSTRVKTKTRKFWLLRPTYGPKRPPKCPPLQLSVRPFQAPALVSPSVSPCHSQSAQAPLSATLSQPRSPCQPKCPPLQLSTLVTHSQGGRGGWQNGAREVYS